MRRFTRHPESEESLLTDLQRRVLIEAEFLFYLLGYPTMFTAPKAPPHTWVHRVDVGELLVVNKEARRRLRGGIFGAELAPGSAIKPIPVKVQL